MTLQEKIDEMYRQLASTKPTSYRKIKGLKRGIAKAEKKRRKLKQGNTIIV